MKMRKTILFCLTLIGLLLYFGNSQAVEIKLSGELVQGGLVHGTTEPGVSVFLDSSMLHVSDEGQFVFGFGHDAPPKAVLLTDKDGTTARQLLEVRQREYATQKIDGLAAEKVTPPATVLPRIQNEAKLIRQARQRNSTQAEVPVHFVWPLQGRITGVYGSRRILNGTPHQPHFGVDIACQVGTLVRAPAAGQVILAHPEMYFSGTTMVIDHGYGVSSTFLHLSEILVAEGAAVKRGQTIAKVGRSGRASGAHLDWRMNWFNIRLDPALLVGEMPSDAPCT